MADEKLIYRYLLGTLTEEENLRFEDEYFTDAERFDALEAAENDLVDSYVHGNLSASDRQQFELHYVNSIRRRVTLSFAGALAEVGGKLDARDAQRWWRQRVLELFRLAPAQKAIFACGFSALMVGVIWLAVHDFRLRHELNRARAVSSELQTKEASLLKQIAGLENRTASNSGTPEIAGLENPPLAQVIQLTPGILRAAGQTTPIVLLTPRGSPVELQLVLDVKEGDARKCAVRIRSVDSASLVLSFQDLPIVRRGGQELVLVHMGTKSLKPGDYIVTLYRIISSKENTEFATYAFGAREH